MALERSIELSYEDFELDPEDPKTPIPSAEAVIEAANGFRRYNIVDMSVYLRVYSNGKKELRERVTGRREVRNASIENIVLRDTPIVPTNTAQHKLVTNRL